MGRDDDYRDVADARGDEVVKAARADPDRFFAVLGAEPALARDSDVVWALGFVKDPRAVPTLLTALCDASTNVRWCAANALSKHRGAAVVNALIASLPDRSSTVRSSIIEALGAQRSRAAITPLESLLARPSIQRSASTVALIEEVLAKCGKTA